MDVHFEHHFSAAADRVIAMYADEGFARARGVASGAIESDAIVDGDVSSTFTVAIRRTIPTDGIQPEFRPFVGPSIAVRHTEVWEAPSGGEGDRDGTFAIEVVGVPAHAAGTLELRRDGEGSTIAIAGVVTATLPFLAGAVAQAVASAMSDALTREFAAGDAWLERPS